MKTICKLEYKNARVMIHFETGDPVVVGGYEQFRIVRNGLHFTRSALTLQVGDRVVS